LGKTGVEDGAGGRESFYGVLVRAPVWCSPNFGDLDDECIVEECRRKGDSDLGEGASLERVSSTDVRFLCIVRFLPYSCTITIRCSLGHGQERRGHRNRGRHKLTPQRAFIQLLPCLRLPSSCAALHYLPRLQTTTVVCDMHRPSRTGVPGRPPFLQRVQLLHKPQLKHFGRHIRVA